MAVEKRTFKSVRRASSVQCVYRKWSEWDVGDVFIGKYISTKIDNYKKPNWIFEVVEAQLGDKKEAKALKGKNLGLNSNGELDRAMETIKIGETVQITYNGKEEMDGGPYKGKDKHKVDVDVVMEEGQEDDVEEDEDEEEDDEDEDL